jgi:hypothetical protein
MSSPKCQGLTGQEMKKALDLLTRANSEQRQKLLEETAQKPQDRGAKGSYSSFTTKELKC